MHLSKAIESIKKFLLCLFLTTLTASAPAATAPVDHFWLTDGTVRDAEAFDGILYAGGEFNYVGPKNGSIGVADSTIGTVAGVTPQIQGTVHAIIPDNYGGWFIGGAFTNVAGQPRTNLFRLRTDLSVDPTIYPPLAPAVYSLALTGNTLAVGGNFRHEAATNLILLNSVTGSPENWQPPPSILSYPVKVLVVNSGKIYTHERVTGSYVVSIDPATQTRRRLAFTFGGEILSLAVWDNTLLVGGNYYGIGSDDHGPIAAIDLQSEKIIGWDPLPHAQDQQVTAIVAGESGIFAAANLARAPGAIQPSYDAIVWAFGPASLEKKWTNSLSYGIYPATLTSLCLHDNKVFVGGDFLLEDNQPRRRLAALNAETGLLDPWTCHASGKVNAIAVAGDRVAFGGQFSSAGGFARENVAAFNLATGLATDWYPRTEPYSRVTSIEVNEKAFFIAGGIRKINGEERVFIGAVDRATGTNLPLNAQLPLMLGNPRLGVYTMDQTDDAIYLGGFFTNSFGIEQRYLVAFDKHTFQFKSSFQPILNDGVQKILIRSNIVYALGMFTVVNGSSHPNLVALNPDSGAVVPSSLTLPTGVTLQNPLLLTPQALFLGQDSLVQSYDPATLAKLEWEGQLPGLGYSLVEVENALIAAGVGGLSYFPKVRALNPTLDPSGPAFTISALPGQNVSIEISNDMKIWTSVLETNATIKTFQGAALVLGENRFYRITQTP